MFCGPVVVSDDGTGCVSCLEVLDVAYLVRERMTDEQRRVLDEIYGIDRGELGGSGPSVVRLNGRGRVACGDMGHVPGHWVAGAS